MACHWSVAPRRRRIVHPAGVLPALNPSRLPEPIQHALACARVPSPSPVLVRLMRLADDDATSLADLADLVGRDPGLAARVLRVANSPAFGRGQALSGIPQCLATLGTRLIRSIATCLSVQRLFEPQAGMPALDLAPFWAHALLVGELSRSIARANGGAPEEAYLAGLLHDVGQLILLSALGDSYGKLLASVEDEAQLAASEEEAMQLSHAEIGAWLVDQWGLDGTLGDGILFHHASPELIATASSLAQTVWMAHVLADHADVATAVAAIDEAWLAGGTLDFPALRGEADRQVRLFGEGLGIPLPATLFGLALRPGPQPAVAEPVAGTAALAEQVAARAVLQPLQAELAGLTDATELLVALREAARILFDVGQVAFLRVGDDGMLNGAAFPDQHAVFRQARLPLDFARSTVAAAATGRCLRTSFDGGDGSALIDRQFVRALGAEGFCCVPVVDGAMLLGVMLCGIGPEAWARQATHSDSLLGFGRIAGKTLAAFDAQRAAQRQQQEALAAEFQQRGRRVVHEAGNPLGIIKTYLALLERKLPAGDEARDDLDVLRDELDRIAGIVERLSEVPAESDDGVVDAARLVRELAGFYRAPLFDVRRLTLEVRVPADGVAVACDADSLKQIVLNLMKNAAEALSTAGCLRIALTPGVMHDGRSCALLEFADDGPGLPDSAVQSLAGAAPATLGARRGHGLSIVGELTRRRHIAVAVAATAGQGTRISLWLPAAADALNGGEAA